MGSVSRLACLLRLPDTGQDWGIEHADPSRIEEFVSLAEVIVPEHAWELEELADLVLQSAEEALENSTLGAETRDRLVTFLRSRRSEFPIAFARWRSLDASEWRVASLLREADGL